MYRQKTRFQPSVLVKRSEQEKAPRVETPGCLQPSPLMQSQETPGQAASAQPCNPQLHRLGGAGGEKRGCAWMMIADWDWMEPSDQRAPAQFTWPPVLGCWLRQAVLPTWPGNKASFKFESVLTIKIPAGVSIREEAKPGQDGNHTRVNQGHKMGDGVSESGNHLGSSYCLNKAPVTLGSRKP